MHVSLRIEVLYANTPLYHTEGGSRNCLLACKPVVFNQIIIGLNQQQHSLSSNKPANPMLRLTALYWQFCYKLHDVTPDGSYVCSEFINIRVQIYCHMEKKYHRSKIFENWLQMGGCTFWINPSWYSSGQNFENLD